MDSVFGFAGNRSFIEHMTPQYVLNSLRFFHYTKGFSQFFWGAMATPGPYVVLPLHVRNCQVDCNMAKIFLLHSKEILPVDYGMEFHWYKNACQVKLQHNMQPSWHHSRNWIKLDLVQMKSPGKRSWKTSLPVSNLIHLDMDKLFNAISKVRRIVYYPMLLLASVMGSTCVNMWMDPIKKRRSSQESLRVFLLW